MMKEAKPFVIDKTLIYKAYLKVKENKGSAGVDSVSIEDYEKDLGNRLYKLWNRMSSGSYMPNAVRLVEIPKPGGGKRPLGIPTVEDRIAQQAAVLFIEPSIEPCFDQDSYGYRPNRSASDAIAKARERCFKFGWVFERYADDTICHCVSKAQAEYLKEVLTCRFEQCRLKLNVEKTKIVQCPTSTRKKVVGSEASFDFLGYTFRCRKSWNRKQGKCFTNFLPAISNQQEIGEKTA